MSGSPRVDQASAVVGSQVVVFGGIDIDFDQVTFSRAGSLCLNTTLLFDANTREWRQLPRGSNDPPSTCSGQMIAIGNKASRDTARE